MYHVILCTEATGTLSDMLTLYKIILQIISQTIDSTQEGNKIEDWLQHEIISRSWIYLQIIIQI